MWKQICILNKLEELNFIKNYISVEYLILQDSRAVSILDIDWYFYVMIVNAKNAAEHKYVVQNERSTFRIISEIVANSAPIPALT